METATRIEYLELALQVDQNVVRRPRDFSAWPEGDGISKSFTARWELAPRFSWAIPNEEALQAIAALSPIVEIGAGTGYWARLLADRGADVVAYDEKPGFNEWCAHEPYFPVSVGSWPMVSQHMDRTLFLCWPPYEHPLSDLALEEYTGQRLVYIGELDGGCCATGRFFSLLESGWDEVRKVAVPQWFGMHDTCVIYQRKPQRRAIASGQGGGGR